MGVGWRENVHLLATGFVLHCSDKRFLNSIWAVFALMVLLHEAVDTGCFKLLQWKSHHNMRERGRLESLLICCALLCCGVPHRLPHTCSWLQVILEGRNKQCVNCSVYMVIHTEPVLLLYRPWYAGGETDPQGSIISSWNIHNLAWWFSMCQKL